MIPGRTMPTFTVQVPSISLEGYFEYIKKVVPEDKRFCFLVGACHLGIHFENDMVTTKGQTVFSLPSLILAAKKINETYPLINKPTGNFESCIDDAARLCEPAEGVDFDFCFSGKELTREETVRIILWITSSNHQYQGDMIHELANNLILSGLSTFKELPVNSTLIDQHFSRNVGVSGKEYFMTLIALWGITIKDFVINRKNVLRESPKKAQLEKALDSILDSLSFKVDEPLTSPLFNHAKNYSGKAKSEAIISLRPLIKIHDDVFFSAGQPYMKIQITRKFLPKALFYARKDSGDPRTELSQFFGARLEAFFKELCNKWNPEGGHFDEYFYDQSEAMQSPDRIAFEKHGNHEVAILFQLKAKTLLEASLFGGPFESVKKDIQSAFSEMIYKSIEYIKQAKALHESGRHHSSSEEITKRVLNAKKIVFMGVSPDVPAIFNSKPIREIVEEKIKEKVGEETWTWLHEHYGRVYWHIISLHEFQAFLCIPQNKQDFHKTVAAYFKDSRLESESISNAGFPDSYRSFVIKKYGSPNQHGQYIQFLPELQDVFNDFVDEVKEHFFESTSLKSDDSVPTSTKDIK